MSTNWAQLTPDFRQKYEKCYCSVLLEGQTSSQVFFLDWVEETGKAPLLHLRNSSFGEVILKYDDSNSDISWKLPEIGLYNYRNNVIMVRRTYGRQYKKGICSATILVSAIYRDIYGGFAIGSEEMLNEELVKVLLQPTPLLSLNEGIDALDKNLAKAICLEFGIGHSPRKDRSYILFYYENPIGTVDPASRRIHLVEGQFKQEFMDFVAKVKGTHDFTIHS